MKILMRNFMAATWWRATKLWATPQIIFNSPFICARIRTQQLSRKNYTFFSLSLSRSSFISSANSHRNALCFLPPLFVSFAQINSFSFFIRFYMVVRLLACSYCYLRAYSIAQAIYSCLFFISACFFGGRRRQRRWCDVRTPYLMHFSRSGQSVDRAYKVKAITHWVLDKSNSYTFNFASIPNDGFRYVSSRISLSILWHFLLSHTHLLSLTYFIFCSQSI